MIPYEPDFYTKAEADELFAFCKSLPHDRKKNKPWRNLKRRLSFPGWSIPYETTRSSYDNMTYDIDAMPQPYQALRNRLSAYAGKDVNYFSTKGYENESDGMKWHRHKEDKVREDQTVWVLSLGAEHLVGIRPLDKNPLHVESFYTAAA